MSVSYVIKIDTGNIVNDALKRYKRSSKRAYTYDMLEEVVFISSDGMQKGKNIYTINKQLTNVFSKHESEVKSRLKRKVARDAGVSIEELKTLPSYEGTVDGAISRSYENTKKQMRSTVLGANSRYTKVFNYIRQDKLGRLKQIGYTGTPEEMVRALNKDVAQSLVDQMFPMTASREKMLRQTEETRLRYEKAKSDLSGVPVIRRLGDREKHCQVCLALEGEVYPDISQSTEVPTHPRCGCWYEEYKIQK